MDQQALQIEAAFSDTEYSAFAEQLDIHPGMFQRYAEPKDWWDWRQRAAHLMGDLAGKSLLDYGCGMGEESVYFAKLGAKVSAIDISPVGVELARRRAQHNGVADRVDAAVMDATHTNFSDGQFDLIHGMGILHHVGLQPGLAEIHRVLKPGGAAVFLEPLGNLKFIERCKYWIHGRLGARLQLREVNEREENLKFRDIRQHTANFSSVTLYPYYLLYRVRKLLFPQRMHQGVLKLDYQLLWLMPFLKGAAGAVIIHLQK